MNNSDWIWIAGILLLVGLANWLATVTFEFSKERRYIKMEIRRALDMDELYHWKKELAALYLSVIPGISRKRAKKIVRRRKKKQ